MKVLVANNLGREAVRLARRFPGRIGHLYSPSGWKTPRSIFPYALDNGAYPCFTRNTPFDDEGYVGLLHRAANADTRPEWVAVPDVVCDRESTLRSWALWSPAVMNMLPSTPLAFVVQNEMTKSDVPAGAHVIFVGGSTEWKWKTVAYWCEHFARVHVGRVNTEKLLWQAHRAGAESCDGSGWFRGDRAQLDGLWYYLADSEGHEQDAAHGPHQRRLFAAGAGL